MHSCLSFLIMPQSKLNIKSTYLLFVFFISLIEIAKAQTTSLLENVVITANNSKTKVYSDENGKLNINVSPKNVVKFKANKLVRYSDFGAKGDGITDDIDAIAATHAFANQHHLMVQADEGATYYIGGKDRTAIIETDTDFGTANFIINDTNVQNIRSSVFIVSSALKKIKPIGVSSLKKNQENINVSFPGSCIVTLTNSNIKQYIRFGKNQDKGNSQIDMFIVDKNGKVDRNTPILWDFDQYTDIEALPIDENTLTITGGHFTTIANKAESKYTYYNRNIMIKRSNVIVDGLKHDITGEGEHGAPYGGFLRIIDCANITVKNTILTGHKTYQTIGNAGVPVSMGSYDIQTTRVLNVSFVNCKQTNDIKDRTYWGIMASNYSKNLSYDNCSLSRFDAHSGVANASIRNSALGHGGINAIGFGTLTIENSTIYSKNFINLRQDYGSTWQGEFVIYNCTFVPDRSKEETSVILFNGYNSGQHNFGYPCYMPERITIENLCINDTSYKEGYKGLVLFENFNPKIIDDTYLEKFPYSKTKEVILKNVKSASGKTLRVSDNPYMFKDVKLINN